MSTGKGDKHPGKQDYKHENWVGSKFWKEARRAKAAIHQQKDSGLPRKVKDKPKSRDERRLGRKR
jgi:hypothetical protein